VARRGAAALLVVLGALTLQRGTDLVVPLALVLTAWGVLRRRHPALAVGCGLAVVTSAIGTAHSDRALVVVSGLAVLAVVAIRHDLVGELDEGRRHLTMQIAVAVGGGGMVSGAAAVLAHPSGWEPAPTVSMALHEAAARLVGGVGPLAATSREARVALDVLPVLGTVGVVLVLVALMAPLGSVGDGDGERSRVAALVGRSGDDSLAPFALRGDKDYVFSADRSAAVGYRSVLGVGLAGGDPVGPPDARADAFVAYLEQCDARGWVPGVIGAGEDTTALARRLGMHAVCIGDEAVVDVASFRLDMPARRNVRQAVQRTRNFGVTTEVIAEHDVSLDLRSALIGVAEEGRRGTPERGFSMILDSLLGHPWARPMIVLCRDAGGAPIAFQRFLPYGDGLGLTLDVMRRTQSAPNGVNERMIVEMIEWGRSHGIGEVSLNFAAFRDIFEAERGLVGNIQYWLVHRFDRFIKIESLYRFNAKFRPGWRRRYVLFRSLTDVATFLPAALVAEFALSKPRRRPPRDATVEALPALQ
jgi:lysyl-tRNA synthetase class 2